METIAEGVQDGDQIEALRSQGCTNIRGYFFNRPVDIGQFRDMIATLRYERTEPPAAATAHRAA